MDNKQLSIDLLSFAIKLRCVRDRYDEVWDETALAACCDLNYLIREFEKLVEKHGSSI